MVERFEKFAFVISNAYRYIQRIETEAMEKYGLKGAYVQYMIVIHNNPDGATATQLSDIADRNKAAVSRALAEMEDKGIIYRNKEKNYYRARIFLTEEGEKAMQYIIDKAKKAVKIADMGLEEKKRDEFYDSLGIITANLRRIIEEGLLEKEYEEKSAE